MDFKIKRLEKILEPKQHSPIDDQTFMKRIYNNDYTNTTAIAGDDSNSHKHSFSFYSAIQDDKTQDTCEDIDASKKHRAQKAGRGTSMYEIGEEAEDEIRMLDKLSVVNMGARYELLQANQMMFDFDVSINVKQFTHCVRN